MAFERLFLAGKIRRHSALRILKMWDFLSCLAEADVTLGVAEHIRRRFDISPTELEEPMRMLEDPPPHVRYVPRPLLPPFTTILRLCRTSLLTSCIICHLSCHIRARCISKG